MNNVFSERTAIEIAFKSLEAEKAQRRAELREDLNKIDDRQYYILERLRELPDDPEPTRDERIAAAQQMARQIEAAATIQAEPITTGTIQAQPIELREKTIQGPLASVPAKPQPTPRKQTAKGKGSPKALIDHNDGVKLLTDILKAAGKPVNAKYIEKEIMERTGVQYTNVYDPIRAWVKHSNGNLQKIGAEYSIRGNR